jgi:hypothetical protein
VRRQRLQRQRHLEFRKKSNDELVILYTVMAVASYKLKVLN